MGTVFQPGGIAIIACIALLATSDRGLYADDATPSNIPKLQRELQTDAMSLSIGQSLTNSQAASLDQRQRLQLQQLELNQRMQQQQLEQQQLRQAAAASAALRLQPPAVRNAQTQIEHDRLSQERRQQLQHFDWQRQQQLQQFQWERQQQSLIKPLAPRLFTIH